MKNKSYILLSLLAFASVFSCTESEKDEGTVIDFVNEIASDSSRPEYGLISSYDPQNVQGNIYIVGEGDRVNSLRKAFIFSDLRDNVTGRFAPDSIPDFAGEVISSIIDSVKTPYCQFIDSGDYNGLREATVREAVCCLDTLCHLSPFDQKGLGRRRTAKVIVLASVLPSAYGKADVDTLFSMVGADIPVLGSFDALCGRVFRSRKGNLNVGVIGPAADVSSGAYSKVFQEYARKYGREGCTQTSFESMDTLDPFREFMNNYIQSGNTAPLDAILVDDFDVDVTAMRRSQKILSSVMSSESLVYGRYLAPGFEIYDAKVTLVQRCYRLLRERNIFTHAISYPLSDEYYLAPGKSGKDGVMLIKSGGNVPK